MYVVSVCSSLHWRQDCGLQSQQVRAQRHSKGFFRGDFFPGGFYPVTRSIISRHHGIERFQGERNWTLLHQFRNKEPMLKYQVWFSVTRIYISKSGIYNPKIWIICNPDSWIINILVIKAKHFGYLKTKIFLIKKQRFCALKARDFAL